MMDGYFTLQKFEYLLFENFYWICFENEKEEKGNWKLKKKTIFQNFITFMSILSIILELQWQKSNFNLEWNLNGMSCWKCFWFEELSNN